MTYDPSEAAFVAGQATNLGKFKPFRPEDMPEFREFLATRTINPESDIFSSSSCAVVLNSPILLEKEYGKLIDSYDEVFRVNLAPTKGYEKHVGYRTTLRLIAGNRGEPLYFNESGELICRCSKATEVSHAITGNFKPYLIQDFEYSRVEENEEFFKLYFLTWTSFYDTVKRELNLFKNKVGVLPPYLEPSSGVLAVMFAMHFFKEIGLFGIDLDTKLKPSDRYHYYDERENIAYVREKLAPFSLPTPSQETLDRTTSKHALSTHNFSIEKLFLKQLLNE